MRLELPTAVIVLLLAAQILITISFYGWLKDMLSFFSAFIAVLN